MRAITKFFIRRSYGFIVILMLLSCCEARAEATSAYKDLAHMKDIAKKYAPFIYMDTAEKHFPSSIEFYAPHMRMKCLPATVKAGDSINRNLFTIVTNDIFKAETYATAARHFGNEIANTKIPYCFFETTESFFDAPVLRTSNAFKDLDFFKGQDPSKQDVPVYVFLYAHPNFPNSRKAFVAQYNTFYPYDYAQDACPSLAPGGYCLGIRQNFGNHVGDWEAVSILFVNDKPFAVHVGSHGNEDLLQQSTYFVGQANTAAAGQPYNWGDLDISKDARPYVYSAKGGHGTYATAGRHVYKDIPTGGSLDDYTSKGALWDTSKKMIFNDDAKYSFLLNKFEGRWGNLHEGPNACEWSMTSCIACGTTGIPTGEYMLNSGPSMPDRQRDKSFLCCQVAFANEYPISAFGVGGRFLSATNGGGGGAVSSSNCAQAEPIVTSGIATAPETSFEVGTSASDNLVRLYTSKNFPVTVKSLTSPMLGNWSLNALIGYSPNNEAWEHFDLIQTDKFPYFKISASKANMFLLANCGGNIAEVTTANNAAKWQVVTAQSAGVGTQFRTLAPDGRDAHPMIKSLINAFTQ